MRSGHPDARVCLSMTSTANVQLQDVKYVRDRVSDTGGVIRKKKQAMSAMRPQNNAAPSVRLVNETVSCARYRDGGHL